MPQMGESIAEGTIVNWLKKAGDSVVRDEPLFEITTDKVDTEVPSPAAGILVEILVREGETVGVGTPVAVIAEAGDDATKRSPTEAPPSKTEVIPPVEKTVNEPDAHFRATRSPQLVRPRREL